MGLLPPPGFSSITLEQALTEDLDAFQHSFVYGLSLPFHALSLQIAVAVGSVKSPGVCHLSGTCQTEGSRICNHLNLTVETGKRESHSLTQKHAMISQQEMRSSLQHASDGLCGVFRDHCILYEDRPPLARDEKQDMAFL